MSGNGKIMIQVPLTSSSGSARLPSAHHITVPVLWVPGQHVHIQNHFHHFARNGLAILALPLALLTWTLCVCARVRPFHY